ncbi:hypothetical protein ACVW1C_003585 [Bradyrhizobium sp. USDA 4011]
MGPEQQKAREVGPQVRPGDPGVPRAVGLRLIRALPGETGLVCHRLHWTRLRLVKRHLPLGRQACTISPSAMRRTRLARFSRPPHPAPNVRDDRDTPLSEEAGRGLVMLSWGLGEEEYFLRADWTGCVALNLLAKFVFWRTAAAAVELALRFRLDVAGWVTGLHGLASSCPQSQGRALPRGRRLPGG